MRKCNRSMRGEFMNIAKRIKQLQGPMHSWMNLRKCALEIEALALCLKAEAKAHSKRYQGISISKDVNRLKAETRRVAFVLDDIVKQYQRKISEIIDKDDSLNRTAPETIFGRGRAGRHASTAQQQWSDPNRS